MNAMQRKPPYWGFPVLLWLAILATPVRAQIRIEAEAVSGEPFGVGRIRVELPEELQPALLGVRGLALNEQNGRVLYPAIKTPMLAGLISEVLESDTPLTSGGPVREELGGLLRDLVRRGPKTTVYFLFRGQQPLELRVRARVPHDLTITPRGGRRSHRQLLAAWWREYTAKPGLLDQKPDYPPMVEYYLATQLARRLDLRLPKKLQTESSRAVLKDEIGLTLGTEAVRIAMQQDRLLGLNYLDQVADQPLPDPIRPPPLGLPEPAADVPVEPLASRVPEECLYLRFGSFANFLWFQDTLVRLGEELENLVASRGLDYGTPERIEEQLVLKNTALSRVLGDKVVADVAVIGTDLFLREGAAFGLLFRAHSSTALGAEILRQRFERLAAGGVTEQKLQVAGKQVSLLHSPDGSVRSYYAADGDYHLLTTSKTLVRRFLETATGGKSLGASPEFRHARTIMPLSRQHTVFVYLSDAFLRNWVSPRYRVEMLRRLQAAADIDLVQLAKLTAATEGLAADTIERLSDVGLLPRDFGPRPDGSRTLLEHGRVYDSLRGRRGCFLPVPDVPLDRVTSAEASAYRRFAEFYREKWGRVDPMIGGLTRHVLSDGRERLEIDARVSPLAGHLRDFLTDWAGPPDGRRLALVPGDLASAELMLKEERLFGGLRDFQPPLEILSRDYLPLRKLRDVLVGYVGFTGEAGLLRFLDLPPRSGTRTEDYSRTPAGVWRRRVGEFTVFSLHSEVLRTVTPKLRFEEGRRPAQLRIRVGDLSNAQITAFLNAWGYRRSRETCLGNLRLMHALDQQLRVPPEDCLEAAEFLLGARLICPLGGQYVCQETVDGSSQWVSTALVDGSGQPLAPSEMPEGYRAPLLGWFRGLELEATLADDLLSVHAELLTRPPERK